MTTSLSNPAVDEGPAEVAASSAPAADANAEVQPVNVAAHLPRMARSEPHRFAVVAPEGRDRDGRGRDLPRVTRRWE